MATMERVFADYNARKAILAKSKHPFADGVAWVAGELVPLHEAKIPLIDQGFLHSDSTYDVPSVWDGLFFRLDDHLERLSLSCTEIRLHLPLPKEGIKKILLDMVSKSGIKDAFVELIVTRGFKGEPEMQLAGTGSAIIARTVRSIPPGSFDPTVKNLQWGDLTRAMFEAQDRDANLTEGSGFNICLVKDGVIYTPDRGVLKGLTRRSVVDVATKNGVEVRVEVVPVEMAYKADEIFMCTTAGGIMPITSLDGQLVKDGKIGPITKKIWDGYWEMHADPAYTIKVDYAT
ncbi:D-aminoacid aminotransferase-like PLP-dependent enzyme [Hyaloscypha hepaticicola]|uniref:D-aminoacid aminotransferase-like PLP-dependent enzyme n=1 Tax=Hyaloscypha hepaticicola TaxID=2082293 RepID=A0A2J6Q4I9_9HELO|nr:D-aminoacid aminotransferase-like PLP-dependent enzyme [Hyaloscypha hepaticicola]